MDIIDFLGALWYSVHTSKLVGKRACPRSRARSFAFLPDFIKVFLFYYLPQRLVLSGEVVLDCATYQVR